MFPIEPVYIIFLVFALACSCFKKHRSFWSFFLISSFILLFIFSRNGADYSSYKEIFDNVQKGLPFSEIHGEKLYLYTNKVLGKFVSYDAFRVIFLIFFLLVALYSINKLSNSLALSFSFMYMGLILYILSIYRQFAVVSIFFYSLHLILNKNKVVLPIFLSFVFIFVHIASVICLIMLLIVIINKKRRNAFKVFDSFRKFSYLIIVALIFRLFLVLLLQNEFLSNLIERITVYSDLKYATFGFGSRLAETLILIYFYCKAEKDTNLRMLFNIYFYSVLFYFAIPLEFFMARLIIHARFLVVVLVPLIYNATPIKAKAFSANIMQVKNNVSKKSLFMALMVVLYISMFVYQMLYQSGYSPYDHMFF